MFQIVGTISENMKSEIDRLKSELRRRSTPKMFYPAPFDCKYKLAFAGIETETPMACLANFEREIGKIENDLSDTEKNRVRQSTLQILRSKMVFDST